MTSTGMSGLGALPLFKIPPYFISMAIYFSFTRADYYHKEELKTVILKALPIAWLLFMVTSSVSRIYESKHYKKYIAVGLLFSKLGDACLVWRMKLFVPGLLFFAIAHANYTYAYGLHPFGGITVFAVCYMTGGYFYMYIIDGIEGTVMKLLVLSYITLIITMLWRIATRLIQNFNLGNLCGFIGAALFVASDLIIAVEKFKFPVQGASFWIMITYFVGQLGIALSACYDPSVAVEDKRKTA